MPIPFEQTTEAQTEVPLRLVEDRPFGAAVPATPLARWHHRFLAHLLDLGLVIGFSSASATFLTLSFLAIYSGEMQSSGKSASATWGMAFDQAHDALFCGCFAFLAICYFVALPAVNSRTIGMGLFGLELCGADGQKPTVRELLKRLCVSMLIYCSGGSLLLLSQRGRKSQLPQDEWTNTSVEVSRRRA